MVKEIRWTQEAVDTFNKTIEYLNHEWTEKEVYNYKVFRFHITLITFWDTRQEPRRKKY